MRSSWREVLARLPPNILLGALVLVLLVFIAYAPALSAGFIFDDEQNLLANPTVRSLDGLRRMWLSPQSNEQYYPLTYSTFWIEYHLWGLAPAGYHAVNIVLHALNVLLLWRLFVVLKVPGAWLAAALFAVHPVESETVVWVAERKNVLSMALALASMLSYFRFAPADADRKPLKVHGGRWYVLAFLLYGLALFSKTAVVALPAVLAVLYWWKRGRLQGRDMVRLVPFFAVGIALSLVTVWVETHHVGAQGEAWQLPFGSRVLLAGRALWFYIGKLLWPYPLMFFYPRWSIDPRVWWQYLFPLAAVCAVVALWLLRGRLGRGPLAAFLIYVGVLAPVLGFFNIYFAQFAQVADHFQYHASAALFALAAAGSASVIGRGSANLRAIAYVLGAILLVVLTGLTYDRTFFYETAEGFYRAILAENSTVWCVPQNLGAILHQQEKYEEALPLYQQAMAMNPADTMLYDGAGTVLLDWGHRDGIQPTQLMQAIEYFREACRLEPRNFVARRNLGTALADARQFDEARRQFHAALEIYPQDAPAYVGLATLDSMAEDWTQAVANYQQALLINPEYFTAQFGLALSLVRAGRFQEAIPQMQHALELDPHNAQAQYEMGNLLARLNQSASAAAHFAEAVRLRPELAEAWYNLGVLSRNRDLDKAIGCFQAALRAKPDYPRAKAALDDALSLRRRAP